MLIKIHDLPVKHPMEGVSFHPTEDAVDRIYWDGTNLDVVTIAGEVWQLDFATHSWSMTETLGIPAPIGHSE